MTLRKDPAELNKIELNELHRTLKERVCGFRNIARTSSRKLAKIEEKRIALEIEEKEIKLALREIDENNALEESEHDYAIVHHEYELRIRENIGQTKKRKGMKKAERTAKETAEQSAKILQEIMGL